ncbi:MAG: hypothetical protein NTV48_00010 [Candidatus Vogelbacteria bacterium]|nr:hypothetical protein [Candidatus Vogelbacteria bacterium]
MSKYQTEKLATQLLRKAGYTWAGRPQRWINPAQQSFERRLLVNPVGSAR